jgi:Uma2 family endonuclease
MNEIARFLPKSPHSTTQVADGLPRLKWTLDEFEALSELGFFGGLESERERLELVGGELIPMNAKGRRHEWVRGQLFLFLARALPAEGGDLYLEPEMLVCKAGFQPSAVPPSEVLLLIEVADTSFKYDAGLKAKIYASLGVREYWVVNAKSLTTTVHLEPGSGGYGRVSSVASSETLSAQALPAVAVCLGDLKIG